MDYNKIITAVFLIILIISDIFIVFFKELVGEYIAVFAMLAIISGLGLIVMIIIIKKSESKEIAKENSNYLLFPKKKTENKICPICKTENKPLATYCTKCGNDLKDIVCPICKTLNSFEQKYCTRCETILQNEKRHL